MIEHLTKTVCERCGAQDVSPDKGEIPDGWSGFIMQTAPVPKEARVAGHSAARADGKTQHLCPHCTRGVRAAVAPIRDDDPARCPHVELSETGAKAYRCILARHDDGKHLYRQ